MNDCCKYEKDSLKIPNLRAAAAKKGKENPKPAKNSFAQ